jgi:MerR family transcriptional regulator, mercuric resistance operon regulatory protein
VLAAWGVHVNGETGDDKGLSIGELSARTACPIETIRYYERLGILMAPPRSESGRRIYSRDHMQQLSFIRRGRALGFSLERIRRLMSLPTDGSGRSVARGIAAAHLEEVRSRLNELQQIADRLQPLAPMADQGGLALLSMLLEGKPVLSKVAHDAAA